VPVIIAVYAHEIPREMGDVGILLKNKFNAMQTIFCNGIINLISLIGVVIGIALGTLNEAVQIYLLSFVAGNFIYIGADIWRNLLKNKTAGLNIL
jgi:zinc and cadmium transporter